MNAPKVRTTPFISNPTVLGIELVPIENILTDCGTQVRERLDDATVAEYRLALMNGAEFPPLLVFNVGGRSDAWTKEKGSPTGYRQHSTGPLRGWLADGFHRLEAHKQWLRADGAPAPEIMCEVRHGNLRDAIIHAVGCNAIHGLRRSNADKRRAIELVLRDEEWSKASDSWIAKQCKVSDRTVTSVREELGIPKPVVVETSNGRAQKGQLVNTSSNTPQAEKSANPASPSPVALPLTIRLASTDWLRICNCKKTLQALIDECEAAPTTIDGARDLLLGAIDVAEKNAQ